LLPPRLPMSTVGGMVLVGGAALSLFS